MGNAATFGVIGAVAGLGEVIGGLLVGNLRFRRLGPSIYAFNALIGVSLAGFAIAPRLPVVLVSAAAFNISIVVANTLWDSALQKHVPAGLIGRVASVDNFGSFLIAPVAPILAATVIEQFGPPAIFLIGGVVSVAFWLVAFVLVRSVRELE
jgi:hypothetical protein